MFKRLTIAIAACAFVVSQVLFAPLAFAISDYELKAVFIINFVKFVEWPGDKAISKQSKIDICVLGDTDLMQGEGRFKEASSGKLTMEPVSESSAANAKNHCHVVFISDSEEAKIPDILATLKNSPVLTVSDSANFAERGGMIGFVMSENRIKLVVNKKSIEAAGMHVDAQLLEIALKVIDK